MFNFYHVSKYFEKATQTHCSKSSFFVQKFNFDFPKKLSIFFRVKNSWKFCGFELFSCWQFWFHEKNCQKKIWVKNSWRFWGFVKIEFLDKNLTFRIVCQIATILYEIPACQCSRIGASIEAAAAVFFFVISWLFLSCAAAEQRSAALKRRLWTQPLRFSWVWHFQVNGQAFCYLNFLKEKKCDNCWPALILQWITVSLAILPDRWQLCTLDQSFFWGLLLSAINHVLKRTLMTKS